MHSQDITTNKFPLLNHPLVEIESFPNEKIQIFDLNVSFVKVLKEFFSIPRARSLCNKVIVLTNYVMNDGMGDWAAIVSVARILRKEFPDQKLLIHAISASCHRDRLIIPKGIPAEIMFLDEFKRKKFNEVFYEAGKVLEIATSVANQAFIEKDEEPSNPDIFNLPLADDPALAAKDTYYGEANKSATSMGLNAKGIIIRRLPLEPNLCNLENIYLKNVLTGNATPSQKDFDEYLETHAFHLAYMHPDNRNFRLYYIHLVVGALMEARDHRSIDICLPAITHNIEGFEKAIHANLLKDLGIGKIRLITWNGGEHVESEYILAEKGKELRLINTFPFTSKDMKILMNFQRNSEALIGKLVGCTGDDSLFRTISYEMIPFYQLRNHKLDLFRNLVEIAKKVCETYEGYPHFLQLHLDVYNQKFKFEHLIYLLKKSLKEPNFYDQVKRVAEVIKKEHSFQDTLISELQLDMLLLYKQDLVKELNSKYSRGELNKEELANKLNEALQ